MGTDISFGKVAHPQKENPKKTKRERIIILQKVLGSIRQPSISSVPVDPILVDWKHGSRIKFCPANPVFSGQKPEGEQSMDTGEGTDRLFLVA
jgi:hypothetical protein